MKIYFTDPALEHLESIYLFIRQRNEKTAIDTYNYILDEIDRLKDFPQITPVEQSLKEFSHTYRSLVVEKTYKIIYYIDGEIVYISAVWDCRRSPEALKKEIENR